MDIVSIWEELSLDMSLKAVASTVTESIPRATIHSLSAPCSPIQPHDIHDKESRMNNQIGSLFSNRLSTAYNQLRGDLGVPQTATDTIDKLVEKIQTSAAVEDRRTAVLGLKGLSRDWKEVCFQIWTT